MFRKRQPDYYIENCTDLSIVSAKSDLKSKKYLRKMEQFHSRNIFEDFIQ